MALQGKKLGGPNARETIVLARAAKRRATPPMEVLKLMARLRQEEKSLLMDTATFTGCMLTARLIGVVEANQRDDKKTVRNDRLIAVATHAHIHGEVKSLDQLGTKTVDEIEHFFISYNQLRGTTFKPRSGDSVG